MNPFGADPLSVAPPVAIEPTEYPKQKAWSISAVRNHAACPLKFKFIRIDRLPEPQDGSGPLARGKAVHELLAHCIQNGYWDDTEVPVVLKEWEPVIESLREQDALAEKQVAFTADWLMCEWYAPSVRARFVFDATVCPTEDNDYTVKVVDWKTGRKYDTHPMDAKLYALAALKMFPEARRADVQYHYVDRPPTDSGVSYACERKVLPELEIFAETFNYEFLNDTIYPARPGHHCNWCYQRKSAGGLCAFG